MKTYDTFGIVILFILGAYKGAIPSGLMHFRLQRNFHRFPRFACSLSMDSKRALKLPLPNDLAPFR